MDLCGPDAFMEFGNRKRAHLEAETVSATTRYNAASSLQGMQPPLKAGRHQQQHLGGYPPRGVGGGGASYRRSREPVDMGMSFGQSWENFDEAVPQSSSSRSSAHRPGGQQQNPGFTRRPSHNTVLAPSAGVVRNLPWEAPSPDDTFVAQVWRITCAGAQDYRRILGLSLSDSESVQAAESRYRHLMRVLHPDKRREDEEVRAGGREVCDEAIALVQRALDRAREEIPKANAVQHTHNTMQRMQEKQRQQARDAMRRQTEEAEEQQRQHQAQEVLRREQQEQDKAGELLQDLTRALSGSRSPTLVPLEPEPQVSPQEGAATAAHILELLSKHESQPATSAQAAAPPCLVEIDPEPDPPTESLTSTEILGLLAQLG